MQDASRLRSSQLSRSAELPRPAVPKYHLAEVWGDVVDLRQLLQAVMVGAVISVGTYRIAKAILWGVVGTPDLARAYALLGGLIGCVAGGVVCALLFPPKRKVVEDSLDQTWRREAIAEAAAEEGGLGAIDDLSAPYVQEMKELGLFDAFAAYEAEGQSASGA
jgi:hypothetical protein